MKWVWTWGGECFGYIDGENLWTYSGKHVGRLQKKEIYGAKGNYLGEVMSENRLITNRAKRSWRAATFTPCGKHSGYAKYSNYSGYTMYSGHEDFPPPDSF